MKSSKQNILFVCLYTLLFTTLIFIGKEIFFPTYEGEEKYVEPSLGEDFYLLNEPENQDIISASGENMQEIQARIYEKYSQDYTSSQKEKVYFRYIPSFLFETIEYSYLPLAQIFLYHRDILSNITDMGVFLYKNSGDTRGRMKDGNIHMYGIEKFTDSEFLSVLIHEFAHYHDIHTLRGNAFGDISQKFYDISWKSVTTIKPGMKQEDFVSGYSMTNWYEDFAETYTYYLLHNKEFALKTQTNQSLKKKYDYMQSYVFPKNNFVGSDYSTDPKQEYYWDITKIPLDVKNFLQSLQEDI